LIISNDTIINENIWASDLYEWQIITSNLIDNKVKLQFLSLCYSPLEFS